VARILTGCVLGQRERNEARERVRGDTAESIVRAGEPLLGGGVDVRAGPFDVVGTAETHAGRDLGAPLPEDGHGGGHGPAGAEVRREPRLSPLSLRQRSPEHGSQREASVLRLVDDVLGDVKLRRDPHRRRQIDPRFGQEIHPAEERGPQRIRCRKLAHGVKGGLPRKEARHEERIFVLPFSSGLPGPESGEDPGRLRDLPAQAERVGVLEVAFGEGRHGVRVY
jgi:hypothetical protein